MVAAESYAISKRPWRRAIAWLCLLAPFFYITYGAANWLAANRSDVGSIVFDWEGHIPFLAWTIIPYWSINVLYGLSLFVCGNRTELDNHGRRLLTAQIVAVACFILLPLRFSVARPDVDGGLSGFLFGALASFDQPFNQAPSLHIAILVILWDLYVRHVPGRLLWPLHVWFTLIGASVLTTYQHHFIDIPTGVLLGLLCLWLWPLSGPPLHTGARLTGDRARLRLAGLYALGAMLSGASAFALAGWWLWLLWPAVALTLVAASYAVLGENGFQKGEDGRTSPAARILLAPYHFGAWINSRLWTRTCPTPVEIADGVYLGRLPWAAASGQPTFDAVVDLCAELPVPGGRRRHFVVPMLDLVPPSADQLRRAGDAIECARLHGRVLVCCALGFSRSVAAVATWLVRTGRSENVEAAVAKIRAVRPQIVLGDMVKEAAADASRKAH